MKNEITKLRKEGKTYKEICEILGCSKGLVSYHCGIGQKTKTNDRTKKRRIENSLVKKIDTFKSSQSSLTIKTDNKSSQKQLLASKVSDFKKDDFKVKNTNFTCKDVIAKFGNNPRCYLTGKAINLEDTKSYSLDHVVPKSRGGKNTLDNMEISLREANQAKSDLFVDEFIELCKSVLIHNGYKIQ